MYLYGLHFWEQTLRRYFSIFLFSARSFWEHARKKKDGFLKGMINEVVDIFVKKDLVLEHEKIQQNI